MIVRQAAVDEGIHRDRRIPDRREAGRHANLIVFFYLEFCQLPKLMLDRRMLIFVSKALVSHYRVRHRREDGAQATALLLTLPQPLLRFSQRSLSERLERASVIDLQNPIQREEEIPPGKRTRIPLQSEMHPVPTADE